MVDSLQNCLSFFLQTDNTSHFAECNLPFPNESALSGCNGEISAVRCNGLSLCLSSEPNDV